MQYCIGVHSTANIAMSTLTAIHIAVSVLHCAILHREYSNVQYTVECTPMCIHSECTLNVYWQWSVLIAYVQWSALQCVYTVSVLSMYIAVKCTHSKCIAVSVLTVMCIAVQCTPICITVSALTAIHLLWVHFTAIYIGVHSTAILHWSALHCKYAMSTLHCNIALEYTPLQYCIWVHSTAILHWSTLIAIHNGVHSLQYTLEYTHSNTQWSVLHCNIALEYTLLQNTLKCTHSMCIAVHCTVIHIGVHSLQYTVECTHSKYTCCEYTPLQYTLEYTPLQYYIGVHSTAHMLWVHFTAILHWSTLQCNIA